MLLIPVEKADLELILSWRNDDGVRTRMINSSKISHDEHLAWFDRMSLDPHSKWYIAKDEYKNGLGVIYFTSIDQVQRTAEWGFYCKPGSPNGTGNSLLMLGLKKAAEDLALSSIRAVVLKDNAVSIHLHKKFGFKLLTDNYLFSSSDRDAELFLIFEINFD